MTGHLLELRKMASRSAKHGTRGAGIRNACRCDCSPGVCSSKCGYCWPAVGGLPFCPVWFAMGA